MVSFDSAPHPLYVSTEVFLDVLLIGTGGDDCLLRIPVLLVVSVHDLSLDVAKLGGAAGEMVFG